MKNSNRILHGDQIGREEKFYRVDNAAAWPKFSATRMLTRDLICGG